MKRCSRCVSFTFGVNMWAMPSTDPFSIRPLTMKQKSTTYGKRELKYITCVGRRKKTHPQTRETNWIEFTLSYISSFPTSPPSQRRRSPWWRRGRRWSRPPAETGSFWRWGRRSPRWCWSCSVSAGTRNRWWPSFCRTLAPRLYTGERKWEWEQTRHLLGVTSGI